MRVLAICTANSYIFKIKLYEKHTTMMNGAISSHVRHKISFEKDVQCAQSLEIPVFIGLEPHNYECAMLCKYTAKYLNATNS